MSSRLLLCGEGVASGLVARLAALWGMPEDNTGENTAEKTASGPHILVFGEISEDNLHRALSPPCQGGMELKDDGLPPLPPLLSDLPENGLFLSLTSASAFSYNVAGRVCEALGRRLSLADRRRQDMETVLQEAVANALIHGNLGIQSLESLDARGFVRYSQLLSRRLLFDEYTSRRLHIRVTWDDDTIEITVADEGLGYDIQDESGEDASPERESPEDILKSDRPSGRGMAIIRSLTGHVEASDHGHRLAMRFSRTEAAPGSQEGAERLRDRLSVSPGMMDSRILVVDDDAVVIDLIVSYLTAAGFRNLDTASDGQEAMEKVMQSPPDLVVLDIVMPRMDGYEVARNLRRIPEFHDLPILVETGYDNAEDRKKAFDSGATDLVIKPIQKAELVARVMVHLENHHLIQGLRGYHDRVESELAFARQMQRDLLPSREFLERVCQRHDVGVAGYFEPSSELGGDFWGVVESRDEWLGVYVVDFTGHGVMSALNTFRLHALLSEIRDHAADPAAYLTALNQRLTPLLPTGQFATMVYGVVDAEKDLFTYAAAGAPSPLFGQVGGKEMEFTDASGVPLGIDAASQYRNRSIPLPPGGVVFLYSDALIESADASGAMMEDAALAELASRQLDAAEPAAFVKGVIDGFYGHAALPVTDDLTAVCLIRGSPPLPVGEGI